MNLTALPTLQKIALLKLASRVCNIQQYDVEFNERTSQMMLKNISSLELPKVLHQSLTSLIQPVMMELYSWIVYIRRIDDEVAEFSSRTGYSCLTVIDLQENLRWQTVGLIDKEQTSLNLIRDERLPTDFRFVLACNCCSETDILRLWQMFTYDEQSRFAKTKFVFLPVVNYWTKRLETAESLGYKFIPSPPFPCVCEFDYSCKYLEAMYSYYASLPSPVRYYLFGTYGRNLDDLKRLISAEEHSEEYRNRVTVGLVNVDNVAALKYFLKKSERIKGQKLLEVVARNHFISNELLVFCLSQMSDDQLIVLLRSGRRSRVLSCLVNSPWQESFWNFIDCIWDNLTVSDFNELYSYIRNFKIKKNWFDIDYSDFADTLWNRYQQTRGRSQN